MSFQLYAHKAFEIPVIAVQGETPPAPTPVFPVATPEEDTERDKNGFPIPRPASDFPTILLKAQFLRLFVKIHIRTHITPNIYSIDSHIFRDGIEL